MNAIDRIRHGPVPGTGPCHQRATRFLNLFGGVAGQVGWRCHAYCLMPNHYHLVVETPEANLSAGMHRLNGGYARWFNRRYNLNGHLFQQRFHAVLVESDWHLLELSRYLALNPVRAGLCRTPAAWPWSSYRLVTEPVPSPAFFARGKVLGYFGCDPERARETFKVFVTDLAA
jgi:putative transposase